MSREKTLMETAGQVIICGPFEEYGIISEIIYTARTKISLNRRDDAA